MEITFEIKTRTIRSSYFISCYLFKDYENSNSKIYVYHEKNTIQKATCTPVFTAALFTIPRTWKQPRCPWTDEWIKKLWYIYTMKYYSAIKRDAFDQF